MSRRFLRCELRQLLLLIAVLSLLLVIVAPRLERTLEQTFEVRQIERNARRLADAQADLAEAVERSDVRLARNALAAGADPNQMRHSSLHTCIARGQVALVELLLAFGADVERDAYAYAGPPLYAAISSNQPSDVRLDMIRLLVEHGADVHKHGSRSAIDIAVRHSDPEVVDLLKEFGVPYGPREMAVLNRLEELRRVVEEDPAVLRKRFRPVYVGRPDASPTLLGFALERGYREMSEFLIEEGAPLDTVEDFGQTPLHMAARGGDPALIRLLVGRGLDVNAKDESQDTPLTGSVSHALPEAAAALIEEGADVDAHGINGMTALHLAVRAAARIPEEEAAFSNRLEVIRVLLAAGADPSLPDRNGESAIGWATDNSPTLAKILAESQQAAP